MPVEDRYNVNRSKAEMTLRSVGRALLFLVASYISFWWVPVAQAAGPLRGMALYQNHCTVCHASRVHVREKRQGKSLAQVQAWIRRWAGELRLGWTDEEARDVLHYLNSQ